MTNARVTKLFGVSWLAVKLGWVSRSARVTWPVLGGAAFLGDIGFTMALFIASFTTKKTS